MPDPILRLFPRLAGTRFEITSPRDSRYNCVAWAAGDTKRWWWPGEAPFSYWPVDVPREESIRSFVEAFAALGYAVTASGEHDPSLEKVALFASSDRVPTHMARQLSDGSWTSKLGGLEDILHFDVTGVMNPDYGEVVAFLQRPRSSTS